MTDVRCGSQIPTSLIGLSIHDEPGHGIHENPLGLCPFVFCTNLVPGPSWIEKLLTRSVSCSLPLTYQYVERSLTWRIVVVTYPVIKKPLFVTFLIMN